MLCLILDLTCKQPSSLHDKLSSFSYVLDEKTKDDNLSSSKHEIVVGIHRMREISRQKTREISKGVEVQLIKILGQLFTSIERLSLLMSSRCPSWNHIHSEHHRYEHYRRYCRSRTQWNQLVPAIHL